MNIIKEFREFFFRSEKSNRGNKKDNEVDYPIKYNVKLGGEIKSVKNRFLKGDYPSEGVFRKLFESITFKLNTEDTATTSGQGLVKKATPAQIRDRVDSENGYTVTVTPAQLPKVVTCGIPLSITTDENGAVIYGINCGGEGTVAKNMCEVASTGTVTKGLSGVQLLANANQTPQTILNLFS